MDKDLSDFVAGYRNVLERAERDSSVRASISWRAVRFVGDFAGRVVDSPLAHGDPAWVRRLHELLRVGELPETVAPCVTVPSPDGPSIWNRAAYVVPGQIDWTGYRHAGGDPSRRPRSGPSGASTPESERGTEQVKLRLSEDGARRLRELARTRGLTVSALVESLVGAR